MAPFLSTAVAERRAACAHAHAAAGVAEGGGGQRAEREAAPAPSGGAQPGGCADGGHGDCLYDCFGVIVHHGSINAGHYTTYVRHCGLWFRCDDAWVVAVSEEEVRAAHAYLLFYIRRGVTDGALSDVASLVPAALEGGLGGGQQRASPGRSSPVAY